MKSRVAVLRVEPSTVLEQTERLCELAGMRQTLSPTAPTILKDNISWHFPFTENEDDALGNSKASSGRAARHAASETARRSSVQNETVIIDAVRGVRSTCRYVQILKKYGTPLLVRTGRDADMHRQPLRNERDGCERPRQGSSWSGIQNPEAGGH